MGIVLTIGLPATTFEYCASQKYDPQNLYPITTPCGGQSLKIRFGAEWRDIAQYQKVSVDGIFDP